MNFEDWIVGFIEAEGSFSIHKKKYPQFCLFQSEYEILQKIRDFFNTGKIETQSKKHGWQYRVYGRNCWVIRNFCEGKLQTLKKIKQFENWKKLRWQPLSKTQTEVRFND